MIENDVLNKLSKILTFTHLVSFPIVFRKYINMYHFRRKCWKQTVLLRILHEKTLLHFFILPPSSISNSSQSSKLFLSSQRNAEFVMWLEGTSSTFFSNSMFPHPELKEVQGGLVFHAQLRRRILLHS